MGFITAAELKSMPLPVKESQWNNIGSAYIEQTIDYATQHVKDYLEKDIEETEYVERLRGQDRDTLMLNHYPIISLDAVSSIDVYGYTRTYQPADFLIDTAAGIIEWVDKYRNTFIKSYIWTVEYTAGYATIPGPIKHATALVCLQMLQPFFRGGTNFASVDLVDESNEHIVDVLERYKRNRIG
jgi:hypothetical protein